MAKVHCQKCGKITRYQDGICQSCRRTTAPATAPAVANSEGGKVMKKVIGTILMVFGIIFLIGLILGSGWLMRGCTAIPAAGIIPVITETTTAIASETAATDATTPTTVPTETTAAPTAIPTATVTPTETVLTSIGIDQPSKSWFLAPAGTLISGDVAIFENDNNSQKIPVYDSKDGTADIIYLTSNTYVWTEWGCYTIKNANAQDVATLINNRLNNGFDSVRYFNGFDKLGTNTPTIISEKINASSITLPTLIK